MFILTKHNDIHFTKHNDIQFKAIYITVIKQFLIIHTYYNILHANLKKIVSQNYFLNT